MRNLLALFALVLLAFVGVGWYLDWYNVRNSPAPEGHQSLNIDINGTKIISDVKEGIQKLEDKKHELRDGAGTQAAQKPAEPPPADATKSVPND